MLPDDCDEVVALFRSSRGRYKACASLKNVLARDPAIILSSLRHSNPPLLSLSFFFPFFLNNHKMKLSVFCYLASAVALVHAQFPIRGANELGKRITGPGAAAGDDPTYTAVSEIPSPTTIVS